MLAYAVIVGAGAIVIWNWLRPATDPIARNVAGIQPPRAADEIPCRIPSGFDRLPLLVVLGQSNAGNHGSVAGMARDGAAWVDGRCYVARDPLPGATGAAGSLWSRFLDTDAPPSYAVTLLAVDASRVSDWTRPGPIADRLRMLTQSLRGHDVAVAAVLWQQGEADARSATTRRDYAAALAALIHRVRGDGITAPWLLAKSTRCRNAGSVEVREAIDDVVRAEQNVFPGPDLDLLGDGFRSDGCHLNESGLRSAASAWQESLARAQGASRHEFSALRRMLHAVQFDRAG